jgi:tetratricopeptide (TPR) repeat protein
MVLTICAAANATAQLAVQQPTERFLVLPFQAAVTDSAASIALADAVRERLGQIAKSKVQVIPKAKLCEALKQSGFPCDGLLTDEQARQLARFLQVHSYLTGDFQKSGAELSADVRMVDIASSGMAASYHATNGNPGTTAALAEAISQRAWVVIRASENVRECYTQRQGGQFARARQAAQKALLQDSNSVSAWLCIATVYEAQRAPLDSIIAASQHALKADSCNGTAWENIARGYQQKGDTANMLDAFIHQLCGEPRNVAKRLGIAQLLRQMKKFPKAVEVLDAGLKPGITPGDPQLLDLKLTICTEASDFRCALDVWLAKFAKDSALGGDTTFLKPAIGAAQQVGDTAALNKFTAAAVRHFPNNVSYLKTRGAYFEAAGQTDSALAIYRTVLQKDPNDVSTSLLVGKVLIDRAVWDTAGSRDTIAVKPRRAAFVAKVDSARPYLRPGLSSADSGQRLAAAVILLTGGSKLAQAGAYPAAYAWLDTLLTTIAPKSAADTSGPKQQIRVNASFWWGISSVLTLNPVYQEMTKTKGAARCPAAHAVFDRLTRTRAALQLGRRVSPPFADQMLGYVAQYEKAKPSVQAAFKCRPPL